MEFIHTGSTLLNLALTGSVHGGWPVGRMSNVIGDKSTGKTLLAIEAATMLLTFPPAGKKPRVVYVEAEAAFDQDYAASLGLPVERVEFPGTGDGEDPINTIESLFRTIDEVCNSAKPDEVILLIVDSMDALSSDAEMARKIDDKSYGAEKQKKMGELFRKQVRMMEQANVHLMIISQIRENIDAMPFSPKFRRSGGKALDFYATHLVWLAEINKLKNSKTDMVYGITCQAKITKNKVGKPFRDIEFPILFAYGTDNISSIVSYLVDEKLPKELRISKATGGYHLLDAGLKGNATVEKMHLNDLVIHIENNPEVYKHLVERVQKAWDWYEDATKVDRRPKTEMMGGA